MTMLAWMPKSVLVFPMVLLDLEDPMLTYPLKAR